MLKLQQIECSGHTILFHHHPYISLGPNNNIKWSSASQVSYAAALPSLPLIGRLEPGAPSPIDFIRALAHPVLETTGATIAALAVSNDAHDE
jgi:hypothetical protein